MKNPFISIAVLLALGVSGNQVYAQTILPVSDIIDWNNAGVPGGIPEYPVQYDVVQDFGAARDGVTDNTDIFREAINETTAGNALYIPEGTFLLTGQIDIGKGIVIRGAGPSKTVIISRHANHTFRFSGSEPEPMTTFDAQAMKGSNEFQVVSAQGISDGDFLLLIRTDGIPHMVEVEQVSGNQIVLVNMLASDFAVGSDVYRFPEVVEGAGVEDLKIIIDQPEYLNRRKVLMTRAAHCWVKNIVTDGLSHAVELDQCFQCEVRDNFFNHSADEILAQTTFGAYGVLLSNGTNMSLIQNNVLHNYRHALVMNRLLGGNVFGYNMSSAMWVHNERNSSIGDMCFHHNFIEGVLVEGNNVELIRFDSNPAGSKLLNVILRNRTTLSGINASSGASKNYLLGNELPDKKIDLGTSINRLGIHTNTFVRHGNYVTYQNEGITWDPSITNHTIPDSYYLTSKPDWFGDLVWPPYGGDLMDAGNGYNPNRIPAEVRYWTSRFPENAPTHLTVTEINESTVELNWTNNSITGTTPQGTVDSIDFIIVRSRDGENFERIDVTKQTTYTDSGLLPGQKYWYYVKARNHVTIIEDGTNLSWSGMGGESGPSNIFAIGDDILALGQDHLSKNAIAVYPNPAKNVLNFNLPDNQAQTISIYSNLGKLISEKKYTDNSVNISGLDKGMYFLVIKGMQKNYHAKFIIE